MRFIFPELELVLKEGREREALERYGLTAYLKTFNLKNFIRFSDAIHQYNLFFSYKTYRPEVEGQTKILSAELHQQFLSVLEKSSTWLALGEINPRLDDRIQSLSQQWRHRISRALPSSTTLLMILKNDILEDLLKMALKSRHEILKIKKSLSHNKDIFDQILNFIEGFLENNLFEIEKNRVINDLFARLHVSTYVNNPAQDDIVHFVLQKLKHLNLLDQIASIRIESKNPLNENQIQRFLKMPHYQGMSDQVFTQIIREIEHHGSARQIASLRQLPLFDENTLHFPTKNIIRGKHIFCVPKAMAHLIPRFRPWPRWLFPNRFFRFEYFRAKQQLIHCIKRATDPNNHHKNNLIAILQNELDELFHENNSTSEKSNQAFLNQWRTLLIQVKNSLANELPTPKTTPIDMPEKVLIEDFSRSMPNENARSFNVSLAHSWDSTQKKILDGLFQCARHSELPNLKINEIEEILYLAQLTLNPNEAPFLKECRRYLNIDFVLNIGNFLLVNSSLTNSKESYINSLKNYFTLTAHPSLKNLERYFLPILARIISQELQNLCETLIHENHRKLLSKDKIAENHADLKNLMSILQNHPKSLGHLINFCMELLGIQNSHLLEIKAATILEGLKIKRSPSSSLWKKTTEKDYPTSTISTGASK